MTTPDLKINITAQELEELQAGETFLWTFPVNGKDVTVLIINEEEGEDDF